jgi:hypothetical protein
MNKTAGQSGEVLTTYERRLVGFADVLGWREHIIETLENPGRLNFLKGIVESWAYQARSDYSVGYGGLRVSSFSDNVVYSQEVLNPMTLLARMATMQLAAAGGGFWMRGGVTIGKIIHTKDCVFGPALNRAYEIEDTVAVYPRIVIDHNVIEECGSIVDFVVNEDGTYFLDPFTASYLQSMRNAPDGAEFCRPLGSRKHIQSIGTHLRKDISRVVKLGAEKEEATKKLLWLYFRLATNFHSSEFSEFFPLPQPSGSGKA